MNTDVPGTIRKRYLVKGKVQHVGYRALVRAFAETLGLKGVVRNLQDKTVEIVCEGEPEAIASLLQMINRKGDPMKPMSIIVKSIEDSPPPPAGEFTDFDIDYGRKLTAIEKESFDRDEIMILGAVMLDSDIGGVRTDVQGVGKDVQDVGQKVDCLGQKMDNVGKDVKSVGSAVRDMHTDMNTRFDHMADRYDMIAASLKEAIIHMDRNAEKTDKAIEKSRKETIIEVHKSEERTSKILKESHNDLAASNRELARAVSFMIRKMSDRPIHRQISGKKKR